MIAIFQKAIARTTASKKFIASLLASMFAGGFQSKGEPSGSKIDQTNAVLQEEGEATVDVQGDMIGVADAGLKGDEIADDAEQGDDQINDAELPDEAPDGSDIYSDSDAENEVDYYDESDSPIKSPSDDSTISSDADKTSTED